jgi:O-antigen/teichoic acid export membrane protein
LISVAEPNTETGGTAPVSSGFLRPSSFAQNIAQTFATRLVMLGTGLATAILVARALGPDGRGLYAVAVAIGAIGVQLGNLGLHASNTFYVAQDRKILPALIGNSLLVSFLFGALTAGATWIVLLRWPGLAPIPRSLLYLALLWIPSGLAYLLLQNLLLGVLEVSKYNQIELLTKLLGLGLLGIVIARPGARVETVFLTGLVGLVAGFLWVLRRLLRLATRAPWPDASLLKGNLGLGFRAYLAAFFAFLVLRVDLLLVKYLLSTSDAGYYSIAATMADSIVILPTVVASMLFPRLSAMADETRRWNLARKTAVLTGLTMLPVVLVAFAFAQPVVRIFFGPAFMPAVPAFIWLLPGIFFLGIETVLVQFLNSKGFPKIVVGGWLLCCVANIALNLWAIPAYGIVGASVVSSICYTLICIVVTLIIVKGSYLPPPVLADPLSVMPT